MVIEKILLAGAALLREGGHPPLHLVIQPQAVVTPTRTQVRISQKGNIEIMSPNSGHLQVSLLA